MSCIIPDNIKLDRLLPKEIVESHNFDWANMVKNDYQSMFKCNDCGVILAKGVAPNFYWILSHKQQKCNERIMLQVKQ